jgi:hypothetical protein
MSAQLSRPFGARRQGSSHQPSPGKVPRARLGRAGERPGGGRVFQVRWTAGRRQALPKARPPAITTIATPWAGTDQPADVLVRD